MTLQKQDKIHVFRLQREVLRAEGRSGHELTCLSYSPWSVYGVIWGAVPYIQLQAVDGKVPTEKQSVVVYKIPGKMYLGDTTDTAERTQGRLKEGEAWEVSQC